MWPLCADAVFCCVCLVCLAAEDARSRPTATIVVGSEDQQREITVRAGNREGNHTANGTVKA